MSTGVALSGADQRALDGSAGAATQTAMRLIVAVAEAEGAERLIDITAAHIDGCLFHGLAGLDFAERLVAQGGRVTVPTTLNVASLDLLHPELMRLDPARREHGGRLMAAYEAMGCEPTWTCAPYQLRARPAFGDQIAWGESNAIAFANSVLGARTNRYGDFLDICAAITGRVPDSGLHRTAGRRARVVFALQDVGERLLASDVLYPVLGHLVGAASSADVIAITGLPHGVHEDRMKALLAAAASSGGVALCHVVGTTAEAADLEQALQGEEPERVIPVTAEMLRVARDELSLTDGASLTTISLGTPHYSLTEIETLLELFAGRAAHPDITVYVSTGRQVLVDAAARGWVEILEHLGVRFVTDTCTYITPILDPSQTVAMTDSGKWAYYAPGNIGVQVVFGSTEECVRSAQAGRIVRQTGLWA